MIARLVLRTLRTGKARFACAAAGVAAAAAAVVFTTSLAASVNAQAPHLAARAAAPWKAWRIDGPDVRDGAEMSLDTIRLAVDYRPGGHVLQGPPMRVVLAQAPAENPYGSFRLAEGRWPDDSTGEREVVCVKSAMRRFGSPAPALGEEVKFVGREGTMTARIVGYLEGDVKPPPQFPDVFATRAAFDALAREQRQTLALFGSVPAVPPSGLLTPGDDEVARAYRNDEQRRMDYARPLMIAAAILTALALLVNSLLLSIEANRRMLAKLRMAGMSRSGAVAFVALESAAAGAAGWLVGAGAACVALAAYVAADPATFPAGVAFDIRRIALTLALLFPVVLAAALFALRPALAIRPLDAQAAAHRVRRGGMAVTFALGFASFVAVEVWGASLMRGFVPSQEWPDAIVSLLPGGVSSFEIEKLRDIPGVRRISELLPLQVFLPAADGGEAVQRQGRGRGRAGAPNALFLAAEWLPRFKFIEGDHAAAVKALAAGDVVITEMMSRAHGLHAGDALKCGGTELRIAGVVDLNWHMVTSRGLVRGLNRMPVMTDGPVFASFDTVESLDRRPAPYVRMTHLWLEYDEDFLARNGVFKAGRFVEAEIARRLGNPDSAAVRLHARDEIADGTLAHGSDLIGAAARVPFVFLFILAVGFVAMLVAEADARRREFIVLRAVGATRGRLAMSLAASALKTTLAGVAFAIPAGALAGWLFSLKTAAIWPGMPHWFVFPWRIVLEGGAGAFVFALVFALPTSLCLVSKYYAGRKIFTVPD